jgi:hypothetical protein
MERSSPGNARTASRRDGLAASSPSVTSNDKPSRSRSGRWGSDDAGAARAASDTSRSWLFPNNPANIEAAQASR